MDYTLFFPVPPYMPSLCVFSSISRCMYDRSCFVFFGEEENGLTPTTLKLCRDSTGPSRLSRLRPILKHHMLGVTSSYGRRLDRKSYTFRQQTHAQLSMHPEARASIPYIPPTPPTPHPADPSQNPMSTMVANAPNEHQQRSLYRHIKFLGTLSESQFVQYCEVHGFPVLPSTAERVSLVESSLPPPPPPPPISRSSPLPPLPVWPAFPPSGPSSLPPVTKSANAPLSRWRAMRKESATPPAASTLQPASTLPSTSPISSTPLESTAQSPPPKQESSNPPPPPTKLPTFPAPPSAPAPEQCYPRKPSMLPLYAFFYGY